MGIQQIAFKGPELKRSAHDTLAREVVEIANTIRGNLLFGVTNERKLQGISNRQQRRLHKVLGENSTNLVNTFLQVNVFHQTHKEKGVVVAEIFGTYILFYTNRVISL